MVRRSRFFSPRAIKPPADLPLLFKARPFVAGGTALLCKALAFEKAPTLSFLDDPDPLGAFAEVEVEEEEATWAKAEVVRRFTFLDDSFSLLLLAPEYSESDEDDDDADDDDDDADEDDDDDDDGMLQGIAAVHKTATQKVSNAKANK